MSNQTLQKPPTKRRTRAKSTSAKSGSLFRRQTARIDGRRDGTPLIFGWGKQLTRMQKQQIQRRAVFSFFGLIIVAVIFVFVFGVIQQNIIIPNEAIVTVNGVGVSQATYQKQLAYDAQVLWNTLQSEIKQQATDQAAAAKGDKNANTQNQIVTTQIQANEANYQQSAITQAVITALVEDQLIQQQDKVLERQSHVPTATLEPSSSAIDAALATFKKAFPGNESYADFLAKNGITEADVRAAIAVHQRRDLLQTYLSAQIVSPTKQVHLRRIQLNSEKDAQNVLTALLKDPNNVTLWSTLAKKDSLDANTKNTGGDMGWVTNYTGDQAIDNWAFAANRKIGDMTTTPLKDSTGTFDVIQLVEIDPSRAVDPTLLKAAQSNAVAQWISGAKADVNTHISTPDSTMLTAARNLPVLPDLNAKLPSEAPQGGVPGAPNGQPGGLP
ncbi:MAG TPA: peptidylprolyl isomerase [Ktedonobacterales bacterium]|nr:peptidylprolyl isomerase [Ktedonobacterales bacterium]